MPPNFQQDPGFWGQICSRSKISRFIFEKNVVFKFNFLEFLVSSDLQDQSLRFLSGSPLNLKNYSLNMSIFGSLFLS